MIVNNYKKLLSFVLWTCFWMSYSFLSTKTSYHPFHCHKHKGFDIKKTQSDLEIEDAKVELLKSISIVRKKYGMGTGSLDAVDAVVTHVRRLESLVSEVSFESLGCANGNWSLVLNETSLPLEDRMLIALKFLDDSLVLICDS